MEEIVLKQLFNPRENACELLNSHYDSYYKRLYNYFYFRIRNHHDAEDLIETVFEKIIKKQDEFDVSRAPFDVWLFTIARNSLIDFTRKTKLCEITEDICAESDPERDVLENERDRVLADAIAMLPEKEKNVLTLKYFAQLNNKEISENCGYSQVNTRVILHRALKNLRTILLQKGVSIDE